MFRIVHKMYIGLLFGEPEIKCYNCSILIHQFQYRSASAAIVALIDYTVECVLLGIFMNEFNLLFIWSFRSSNHMCPSHFKPHDQVEEYTFPNTCNCHEK